MTFFTNYFKLN